VDAARGAAQRDKTPNAEEEKLGRNRPMMQPAVEREKDRAPQSEQTARGGDDGNVQKTPVARASFLHAQVTFSAPRGPHPGSFGLRCAFEGLCRTARTSPTVEDGARLMERVRARDPVAFEHIYDAYHRLVFGIALRMLTDTTMAEDLTQSVFLKIWTSPESFREGNFSAWLSRVTRNRALDVLRSRAAHMPAEIPADIPSEGNLDDIVFAKIDSQRVRAALAALPDEQRSLIEMGFFAGVTHEEIARRTSIPLGTVKTRIRSGLRRLRGDLQGAVSR
jgi:RNA polymerase sigma-70 factor, ECF subfamily